MIRSILLALDDSPRAAEVARFGVALGACFRARTHPLRVVTVPPEFPAAAAGNPPDALAGLMERTAQRDLQQLLARAVPGAALEPALVREGEPWPTIVEVADELDVDVIVIGSHGYHGWDRILGTTTLDVVKHSSRNVFVVQSLPTAG